MLEINFCAGLDLYYSVSDETGGMLEWRIENLELRVYEPRMNTNRHEWFFDRINGMNGIIATEGTEIKPVAN